MHENEKLQEDLQNIQESQKELHSKLDALSKAQQKTEDNNGGESSQKKRYLRTQSSRFTYELRPVSEETDSDDSASDPDTPNVDGPDRDDTTYGQ